MSELRKDLISGDWVLLATGRAARPNFLEEKRQPRKPSPIETCPFEHGNLKKTGNWPPLLAWPNEEVGKIVLLPNKYPAVTRSSVCSEPIPYGIYDARTAVGAHDLLVTRDHEKSFADLEPVMAAKLFEMFQAFHVMSANDKCAAHVASFCNWGPSTGASVWHPHYQLVTLPILPPHIEAALQGAGEYYRKTKRCARCDMVKFEKKEKMRVIDENTHAIAIAPYASKTPFEVNILPKKHGTTFREAPAPVVRDVALMLRSVLKRLRKYANDPDYNFYVHDAPLPPRNHAFHHWHVEVVPHVTMLGGFEVSTHMNINVLDPDRAAAILRGVVRKEKPIKA